MLPTSKASYLSASKKILEEARKKAQEIELLVSEETEAGVEEISTTNYGPGNLSPFRGFADDGFDANEGNDGEMAPVMSSIEQVEEEPSLLIFGNESDGEEPKLLL